MTTNDDVSTPAQAVRLHCRSVDVLAAAAAAAAAISVVVVHYSRCRFYNCYYYCDCFSCFVRHIHCTQNVDAAVIYTER